MDAFVQNCQHYYTLLDQSVHLVTVTHWTYWPHILSELCFQSLALSGNYEIVALSTDKNTFFNDLDYKTDIAQYAKAESE